MHTITPHNKELSGPNVNSIRGEKTLSFRENANAPKDYQFYTRWWSLFLRGGGGHMSRNFRGKIYIVLAAY